MITKEATTAEIQASLHRRPHKSKLDLETQLLNSILEYLGMIGLLVDRRNVGAMEYRKFDGKRGMVRFGKRGQADLWFIAPGGVHGEIEVKAPGKQPTFEQTAWLSIVRQTGAIAFWCDSIETCADQLKYEYGIRGWKWQRAWDR